MDTLPLAYDWILLLDADEVLTPELADEIQTAIQDPHADGYYIALQMYFLGRRLRHSGASFWKLSLFRKGLGPFRMPPAGSGCQHGRHGSARARRREGSDAQAASSAHPSQRRVLVALHPEAQRVLELGGARLARWQPRQEREEIQPSLWGTQAQRRRWLRRIFCGLPGSPLLFFFYKYFVSLGFLDGVPGLIYCAMQGIQFFHIKAKIYELRDARRN